MILCGDVLIDLGRLAFRFAHEEANGEEEHGLIVIFAFLRIGKSRTHASSL